MTLLPVDVNSIGEQNVLGGDRRPSFFQKEDGLMKIILIGNLDAQLVQSS